MIFVDTVYGTANAWAHAAIYTSGQSGYNGDLIFATDGDNLLNTNPTEKMRILANGNVGIGTTNPDSLLEVGNPNVGNSFHSAVGGGYAGLFENVFTGYGGNVKLLWVKSANQNPTNYHFFVEGNSNPEFVVQGNGNVGIGTTAPGAKLDVAGNVKLSAAGSSITFPDGTVQSTAWAGTLCGGDYAESVNVTGERSSYEPGDVLVINGVSGTDVIKSSESYSTLVGGIFSTKPGLIGRRQTGARTDREIPMAMVGIVPTKVTAENGPIKRGDLLVTSSKPGYAMKGTDPAKMLGAVIGKALGPLDSGTGMVEVLVSLQ
jgi:hypothetical protein